MPRSVASLLVTAVWSSVSLGRGFAIMAKIFISHSSHDRTATQRVVDQLRAWGIEDRDIFLDYDAESGILAGSSWEQSLQQNLASARFIICVLTPNWISSEWCRAEYRTALLAGKYVIVLVAEPCDHEPFGASVQKLLEYNDSESAFAKLERAIAEAGFHPTRSVFKLDTSREPFPGMRAFEEEDAAVYFGRDAECEALLERISASRVDATAPRFHVMLGASGSGKSSLLRAGLLARVRRREREWLVVPAIRPHQQPLRALAEAIHEACKRAGVPTELSTWLTSMNRDLPDDAWRKVASALGANAGSATPESQHPRTILLPIDQLEELLRLDSVEERERCVALLKASGKPEANIILVATIRTDSFHEFQKGPVAAIGDPMLFSLSPLPVQEIATVIREPARVAGVSIEPGLIRRASEDAPSGDLLPLLAFTLNRLWRECGSGGVLAEQDYVRSGGVVGAIRSEWESARRAAIATEESLLAIYVPRLAGVNLAGEFVRRRAASSEFTLKEEAGLAALIERRLLIVDGGASTERFYDVPHEAILRSLPQIANALGERAEDITLIDKAGEIQRRLLSSSDDVRDGVLLELAGSERAALKNLATMPGWAERVATLAALFDQYDRRYAGLAVFATALAVISAVAFLALPTIAFVSAGHLDAYYADPTLRAVTAIAWTFGLASLLFFLSFARRVPFAPRRWLSWSLCLLAMSALFEWAAIRAQHGY